MSGFGFDKQQRLLTAADFKGVFDSVSARASSRNLLLLAAQNNRAIPRIGFIIAKKNVRTAVQRNRIKRVLREQFRHANEKLPPVDMVIIARKGLDNLENDKLRSLYERLCNQLVDKLKCGET